MGAAGKFANVSVTFLETGQARFRLLQKVFAGRQLTFQKLKCRLSISVVRRMIAGRRRRMAVQLGKLRLGVREARYVRDPSAL